MNRATIRKLYREAIVQVFGCEDKGLDADLIAAAKKDVRFGRDESVLEIFCEGGVPNASDIFNPADYGFPGKVSYNSDSWDTIDGVVNLMLEAMGRPERYRHEPYNSALVSVWEE